MYCIEGESLPLFVAIQQLLSSSDCCPTAEQLCSCLAGTLQLFGRCSTATRQLLDSRASPASKHVLPQAGGTGADYLPAGGFAGCFAGY